MTIRLGLYVVVLAVGFMGTANGQPLAFSTLAGAPPDCAFADGFRTEARFCGITRLGIDDAGNLYVADSVNAAIRKIAPGGTVSTVAVLFLGGGPRPPLPGAMTVDGQGNVYYASTFYIRKLAPDGTDTRVTDFTEPIGLDRAAIAVDRAGNLFIAQGCRLEKIRADGTRSLLAGSSTCGGADGMGSAAQFASDTYDMAVDRSGTLYLAELQRQPGEDRIRRIRPDGSVTTLARVPPPWPMVPENASKPGGTLSGGLAADANGNVFFSSTSCWYGSWQGRPPGERTGTLCDATIRKIEPDGRITVIAGYPDDRVHVDGSPGSARFRSPAGMAMDMAGNLYIADGSTIRKVAPDGTTTTFAGPVPLGGAAASGGLAVFGADASGNLYGAGLTTIGTTSTTGGWSRLIAGLSVVTGSLGGYADTEHDGVAFDARFHFPTSGVVDASGNMHVADGYGIRHVTPTGRVTTLAAASESATPRRLVKDESGILYATVVDASRQPNRLSVQQLIPTGLRPVFQLSGTNGLAGLAYSSGFLYVTDRDAIYRTNNPAAGVVLFAGAADVPGSSDGGAASARFTNPGSLAADRAGRIYVSDDGNCAIRVISSGAVSTLATSLCGDLARDTDPAGDILVFPSTATPEGTRNPRTLRYDGLTATIEFWDPLYAARARAFPDGTRSQARFSAQRAIAADYSGNAYVLDGVTARRVTAGGEVTTLAGTFDRAGSADGLGSAARFGERGALAADTAGNLYVADTNNYTVRKITPDGRVSTIAGTAGQQGTTDGNRTVARFSSPIAIAVDPTGRIYVADGEWDAANGAFRDAALRVVEANGTVSTLVASLGVVTGLSIDGSGAIYVAHPTSVRKMTTAGISTLIIGSSTERGVKDGPASEARFLGIGSISADEAGNVYVSDNGACTIRRIRTDGNVETIGGPRPFFFEFMGWITDCGYVDDIGARAKFSGVQVAADPSGGLWIADDRNGVVRRGTAVAVPAITSQPSSVSVRAGLSATFSVQASGSPVLSYTWQTSPEGSSWSNLEAGAPYAGTGTASLTIAAVPGALHRRYYRCIVDNGAGTATSQAALLMVLPPHIVSPSSLQFGATKAGATSELMSVTGGQWVTVAFGAPVSAWTAVADQSWLQLISASGSNSGTFTATIVNPGNVIGSATTLTAMITVTAAGAPTLPVRVPVTLSIDQTGQGTAPLGVIDTPSDGAAGVTGSIPVTGWAIDDIEVARVRILRDPVAGEPAGLVFIGDAVLVDGARPDVQASYPALPRNSRAGWGYLMLTNFLPNLGNGTFRLHAIADDADGHSTTLGTRTITCANSTATAPFGAIDTPGQGETVTTASYNNFGWVLSPGSRRSDPPSGGAVQVVIDGALGVTPAGWVSRSDLVALFPAAQFSGVGNALGVATLNIAALTNGVHTISWLVTDNQGTASGIGSRYFTVANSALTLAPDRRQPAMTVAPARSVTGRRGYGADTAYQIFAAGPDERITIHSEEIDRIELQLGAAGDGARLGETFTGHMRVGEALHALPPGSALDRSTGQFTWQPGVGFVGPYDLVFARWEDGRGAERYEVRVVLNPKGSNRSGPQTIIDLPSAGATVTGPFVLAGWAADLDAVVGAGVNTVHVWAYPILQSGYGDPIWIGAAGFGGARPDVAAVYGDRFLDTGYGITVPALAPGTYDLAVFAYSTVRGTFLPARTVRVVVKD